ncbi:unnamed protein product [Staurois parvus]|uniref:Uncharacterized protein n=1 Tax=Staurois parvus TaxID=386267 RepID=A0ABN9GYE2_9NEOB|nr:unnamed protein product [Staurois parvus]
MLLPRPLICHWAPVPPPSCCCQAPNSAMGPLYRLLMLLPPRSRVDLMGPCTASLLLLSPSPTLCHVPLSGLLTLLVMFHFVIECCTASHCCCLHRHTLPCATFRSPHTAGGFHFCHRMLYGSPIAAARSPLPHCGSTHYWFWPRDCPNE